jgi:hypothetical protein
MTAYNLFIMNKDDHILTGMDFQSMSDADAITWASFVVPTSQIGEIWCGTRRVGRSIDGHFRGSTDATPARNQSARKRDRVSAFKFDSPAFVAGNDEVARP